MKRTLILVVIAIAGLVATVSIAAALGGGPEQRPVNDRLDQATDLTFVELPASDRVDASKATAESNEPAHVGSAKASVWWQWTARSSGQMRVSTAGSDVSTVLAIYTGQPPSQVIAGSGGAGQGVDLTFAAVQGDTYLFVIDQTASPGEVEFGLRHNDSALPNDDFADAILLSGDNVSFAANTTLATAEISEPDHAGEPAGQSAWWQWTASSAGLAEITTCGSVIDTLISVTTGNSFGGLIPVAMNDDIVDVASTTCDTEGFGLSQVEFLTTAGQTYNIAVDGFAGSAGPITGSVVLSDCGVVDCALSSITILDEPCVVYNSTNPMNGGDVDTVQVTGALTGQNGDPSCVPAGATAGVFTISSVDPLTEGNLRMTPAGTAATGNAGVVNYGANNGFDNANTVTVPLSASGAVDIAANAGPAGTALTTDVQLMVIGYYSPTAATSLKYFPITPCAAADTRTNQGANGAYDGPNNDGLWPVGNNFPDIDVVGTIPAGQGGGNGSGCGVPATADAVVVNLVAVNAEGGSGFLSVAPGGQSPAAKVATPFAVLNPKMNNSATTIINLNGGETIAIDIDGDAGAKTAIRAVVVGYYDNNPQGLGFTSVTPCAAFDSRGGQGASGNFAGLRKDGINDATTYTVAGNNIPAAQGGIVDTGGGVGTCGVPDGASAVLINLVAVNAETEGNFRAYEPGTPTLGGVLNFAELTPKMNNSNVVAVPIDASGQMTIEVNAGPQTPNGTNVTHARGIILGYYN